MPGGLCAPRRRRLCGGDVVLEELREQGGASQRGPGLINPGGDASSGRGWGPRAGGGEGLAVAELPWRHPASVRRVEPGREKDSSAR